MSDKILTPTNEVTLPQPVSAPPTPTVFRRTCKTCRTFQSCWDHKCCRQAKA